MIRSDSSIGGAGSSFSGTQGPGKIAVVSSLTASGAVIVDPPVLTGTTAATTSEFKLGIDGDVASTPLHVRFSTTQTGGKFANGTYSAVSTVTCTDDAKK